jgi:PAS domain S-box-containing protein/putative nucleotidyltransferase with HDIG domain
MKRGFPRPLDQIVEILLIQRLLVPVLVAMVVVIGASGVLVWQSLTTQQAAQVQSLAMRVEDYLATAAQILSAAGEISSQSTPAQNQVYLEKIRTAYRHFDTFYRLDQEGRVIQIEPHDPRYIGLDMSRQPYFQVHTEPGKTAFTEPFTSLRSGRPAVYMIQTLSNGELIVGELNLEALQAVISVDNMTLNNNHAYITSASGVLLAHSNPEMVSFQQNMRSREPAESGNALSTRLVILPETMDVIASSIAIHPTGWIVVVEAPFYDNLSGYLAGVALALVMMPLFSIALVLHFGQRLRRSVVQPLAVLNQRVNQLTRGDFSHWMSFSTISTSSIEIAELATNFQRMQQTIRSRQAALQTSEARFREMAELLPEMLFELDNERKITYANRAAAHNFGYSTNEFDQDLLLDRLVAPEEVGLLRQVFTQVVEGEPVLHQIYRFTQRGGGTFPGELSLSAVRDREGDLTGFRCVIRDLTDRMLAEENLRRSFQLFTQGPVVVFRVQAHGREIVEFVSQNVAQFGYRPGDFRSRADFFQQVIYPADIVRVNQEAERQIAAGSNFFEQEYRISCANGEVRWVYDFTSVSRDPYGTPSFLDWYILDITERKQAEERISLQLQRLGALQMIDASITANADLTFTLQILVTRLIELLNVDAALVLRYNPKTRLLEFACGDGFHIEAPGTIRLRLGESYAGKVAETRQPIKLVTSTAALAAQLKFPYLIKENFVTYYGLPLVAKGEVRGVLEIFHRSRLEPDREWMDFLETLAGQAAIAIHNAELLENLQRSNEELKKAYKETIMGWARALELRDKETENHSKRVVELTMHLARKMNFSDEALEHVWTGTLLHDIGKMAIPDRILQKDRSLDKEEWETMREHPLLAMRMLSAIDYVKPAIEIPLYHHERWDGTGYPYGLKAEEIPLSARIFAIVDVWDALSFDRPYRKAWTQETVREYLLAQAGKHFDPKLVEPFLEVLNRTGELQALFKLAPHSSP